MQAPKDLVRQLPDLDVLVQHLEDEREDVVAHAFPPAESRRRMAASGPLLAGAISLESMEAAELPDIEETSREHWLEAGSRAVRKLHSEGEDADLDAEEIIGLEAIVQIEGRPAILIQEGRFFPPPIKWQILEQVRDSIEMNCKSVGRIEVDGHPSFDWVGTGFLVAEDVIMTNRHVAKEFCRMEERRRWKFEPGMGARIDYVEEMGALNSAEFTLKKVIGVHEEFDLALFRVERKSLNGLDCPPPLTVASKPPSDREGRVVYCVGYPAWDGRRNDPDVMRKIFSNIFDVKRLQPGEIVRVFEPERLFLHDCSTLGGNSGSCVIDLESNQIIGLHFGGRYMQGNYAVALWQLVDDPLIKKAKLNFA